MSLERKIPVAVLGATGQVGQRFLTLLADHPWFTVAAITASERSAGRRYGETVRWSMTTPIPPAVRELTLAPTTPDAVAGCRVAFSALASSAAGPAEIAFAEAGMLVVSNAKSHRMDPDVPLVVPEVNPGHLALAAEQCYNSATPSDATGNGAIAGGAILTNPNCSTIGLVSALAPLDAAFGLEQAHAVTLQAVSGAGIPGVPSLLAIDNIVPFIPDEEDKLEVEPHKILGTLEGGVIRPHPVRVSAACNRVPVIDGHTLCLSVTLREQPSLEAVREVWSSFRGEPQRLGLPSAPAQPIVVLDGDDAPQPRLHRDLGAGMATSIGRLRPCPLLGIRFVVLSHNTVRGAAGGALLLGELAAAKGMVPGVAVEDVTTEVGAAKDGAAVLDGMRSAP